MPSRKSAGQTSNTSRTNSSSSKGTNTKSNRTSSPTSMTRENRLSLESPSITTASLQELKERNAVNTESAWYEDEELVKRLLEIASSLHVVDLSEYVNENSGNYSALNEANNNDNNSVGMTENDTKQIKNLAQVNEQNIDQLLHALTASKQKEKMERVRCELTFLIASAMHCNDYEINLVSQYTIDQIVEFIEYCASYHYSAAKTIHLLSAWYRLKKCIEQSNSNNNSNDNNNLHHCALSSSLIEMNQNEKQQEVCKLSSLSSKLSADATEIVNNTNQTEVNADAADTSSETRVSYAADNNIINKEDKQIIVCEQSAPNSAYENDEKPHNDDELFLSKLSEFMQKEVWECAQWQKLMEEKTKMDLKNEMLYGNANINNINTSGGRRSNKVRNDGSKSGGNNTISNSNNSNNINIINNIKSITSEEMERQQKFNELIASLPQENIYLDNEKELFEFVRMFVKESLYQHAALFKHNYVCNECERRTERTIAGKEDNSYKNCNASLHGRKFIDTKYTYLVEQPFSAHPLTEAISMKYKVTCGGDANTTKSSNELHIGANSRKDASSTIKKRSVSKEKQISFTSALPSSSSGETIMQEQLGHALGDKQVDRKSNGLQVGETNNKGNIKPSSKKTFSSSDGNKDMINMLNTKKDSISKTDSTIGGRQSIRQAWNVSTETNTVASTSPHSQIMITRASPALSKINTLKLTLHEWEHFHTIKDDEINRMIEQHAAEVEADKAREITEQHTREMMLHLENKEAAKMVEDVYESMEDELTIRQGKILQRICALENALGITQVTSTVVGQKSDRNSVDARNRKELSKSVDEVSEKKNKKTSARPMSSSAKRKELISDKSQM